RGPAHAHGNPVAIEPDFSILPWVALFIKVTEYSGTDTFLATARDGLVNSRSFVNGNTRLADLPACFGKLAAGSEVGDPDDANPRRPQVKSSLITISVGGQDHDLSKRSYGILIDQPLGCRSHHDTWKIIVV